MIENNVPSAVWSAGVLAGASVISFHEIGTRAGIWLAGGSILMLCFGKLLLRIRKDKDE